MSEREPRDIARVGQWAVERLADRIGQAPQPTKAPDYGDGLAYILPVPSEDMPRSIEFFEEERVVTLDTPNLHVELFNAARPRPAEDGIFVEDETKTTRILFLRNGHIAVEALPPTPTDAPGTSPTSQPAQVEERSPADDVIAPRAAGDEIRASGKSSPDPTTEGKEKQPTVRVKGIVYRQPSYKPTPNGTPRVLFQLAEHPDETDREKTVHHYVYSTGQWATKIQEKDLRIGEPVRVSGYKQTYETRNRAGEIEPRERLFAIHVQQLRKKTQTTD